MTCLDDQRIAQFVEGLLSPEDEHGVQEHVDRCDDCRRVLSDVARVAELASGSVTDAIDADSLAPGSRIDRYVIGERIGAGALGVVYAAFDPELDRGVAIKVLRPTTGTAAELRTLLRHEAQALGRLDHPNVVAVHDVGAIEDTTFIVMELVEGSNLRRWLGEQRPGWRDVVRVFAAAGRGLAAAHAAGLVHRDFKPDNILIGTDGLVRISDFGVVGTPAYMAPEQLDGGQADERTDQFSFCVALYEGLYGGRPFTGATLGELRRQVAVGGPIAAPASSEVPRWLHRVVVTGLAVDPTSRFRSMAAVLDALSPARRTRRLRIAGAVAAALSIVAVAATLGRDATHPASGIDASKRTRRIHGRVVDPRGAPIAGADVVAGREELLGDGIQVGIHSPTVGRTKTDRTGAFALDGLEDAAFIVAAQHDAIGRSIAQELTTDSGDKEIVLALHGVGSIAGSVTADGTPAAGYVVAFEKSAFWHRLVVTVGLDGAYAFPRLAEGEYTLLATYQVRPGQDEYASATVRLRAGDTERVPMKYDAGDVTLTVSVTGEGAASAAASEVFVFTGEVDARSVTQIVDRFLADAAGCKMATSYRGIPALVAGVHRGPSTICVIPLAGDVGDPGYSYQLLSRADDAVVYCRPYVVDAAEHQTFTAVVPLQEPTVERASR